MSTPRPGAPRVPRPASAGPASAGPTASDPASAGPASAGPTAPAAGRSPLPWRGLFFAAAALAIVAGAAWAVLGSRFLVVRSVRVEGAGGLVSAAQVRSAAAIPMGLPMLRVSGTQVARRVELIRQVQSAQVSRDWPDTVVISVRPRTPVFAVGVPGNYQLVDGFGVSVARSSQRPPGLPVLTVGRGASLARDPAVRAAAVVLRELPRSLATQVRSVTAVNASDVSVRLSDGVMIVWGGVGRPAQKARELTVLMRTRARVYDVSAPGTAVTEG